MKELSKEVSNYIEVINENEIYYRKGRERIKIDYLCLCRGTLIAVDFANNYSESILKYSNVYKCYTGDFTNDEKNEIISLFKYSFQITNGVSAFKIFFNDGKLRKKIKLTFSYCKGVNANAYISIAISGTRFSEVFGITTEKEDREKFKKHLNLVEISDEKWQQKYLEKGIPNILEKFDENFSENKARLDTLKNGKIGFCCFDASKMRFTYIYMYEKENENHLRKLYSYGKDARERFSLIQNVMKCAENPEYTSFDCYWYSVIVLKEILFNNFNFKRHRYTNDIYISFSPDIPNAILTKENLERLREIAIEYFGNEEEASAWLLAAELAD